MNFDMKAMWSKPDPDGYHHLDREKEERKDTAETVVVSALSLMKMLRHARSGVPFEVMGLLIGEFVDELLIKVVDVFAMPQIGNTTSVEAVDEVYQLEMVEMLKRVSRTESIVGWFHSHPGYGCWLSSVDQRTQEHFELLHPRAIAIVIDPVQSVKGKVIIDAFRNIDSSHDFSNREIRIESSIIGLMDEAPLNRRKQVMKGLNRRFYKLILRYQMNENERMMMMNVKENKPVDALRLSSCADTKIENEKDMETLLKSANAFYHHLVEEELLCAKEKAGSKVNGKNAKHMMEEVGTTLLHRNLLRNILSGQSIDAFQHLPTQP